MLHMTGVSGELRRSYHTVGRLGVWTLDTNGRLVAEVTDEDEFHLEQGGSFGVRLRMGRRLWSWREAAVISRGGGRIELAVEGSPRVTDA